MNNGNGGATSCPFGDEGDPCSGGGGKTKEVSMKYIGVKALITNRII